MSLNPSLSFITSNYSLDLSDSDSNIKFKFQENQLGTGDAVKSGLVDYNLSNVDNVLVVFGDS